MTRWAPGLFVLGVHYVEVSVKRRAAPKNCTVFSRGGALAGITQLMRLSSIYSFACPCELSDFPLCFSSNTFTAGAELFLPR